MSRKFDGVPELPEAYRHCESVTRTRAANFYYGIRLLDADRRRAMCAVYAFARRVDDIGDGALPGEEKLRGLSQAEAALGALREPQAAGGESSDPVIVALADAQRRFSFPASALADLIEGVRMDVSGVQYESFEDLVLYCRRVAGAIGRVSLAIFGVAAREAAEAESLADDLGVALQLTNILRDLREDAQGGRVYLPAEDLRRFGVDGDARDGGTAAVLAMAAERDAGQRQADGDADELARVYALVRFEADRAQVWFRRGLRLTALLDRRSAACVRAMAGIYHRLLERIASNPELVLRERVSLPAREKAWVAARSLMGGRT